MTILFYDGFDTYASALDIPLNTPWGSNAFNNLLTGRFTGSKALSPSSVPGVALALATTHSTLSVGFAINAPNLTSTAFLRFLNGTTVVCQLGLTSLGEVMVGRTDLTSTLLGKSGTGAIAASGWYYVEVELTRATGTGGTISVYVNGTQVCTFAATNTGASDIDHIAFCGLSNLTAVDDLYVTDVATKLGECRIDVLHPSADSSVQWTKSTGSTNAGCVDEAQENGDTDYVSDGTVGHKDLYDVTDLSFTPASIFSVQAVMWARKDDATLKQIRTNIKSGATTSNGGTKSLSSSYQLYKDTFDLNPTTGLAWTASDVNGAQLGLEVVT